MEHTKSPVIASQEYYPLGLTFNLYRRENGIFNRIKFQGQEHIDDLNLGWDSFKWRNHQPDIDRFFNIDPLSEKYVYNSVYAFSENKVVAHRELEGLESVEVGKAYIKQEVEKVEVVWDGFVNKVEEAADQVVEVLNLWMISLKRKQVNNK